MDYNFENLRYSISKMIDKPKTNLHVLHTILSNIITNPNESKYKRVQATKLNECTRDILTSIGFKYQVEDFKEYLVYTHGAKDDLVLFLEIINKKMNEVNVKKQHQLDIHAQLEKEKELVELTHVELMNDRFSRRKYGGWLT